MFIKLNSCSNSAEEQSMVFIQLLILFNSSTSDILLVSLSINILNHFKDFS